MKADSAAIRRELSKSTTSSLGLCISNSLGRAIGLNVQQVPLRQLRWWGQRLESIRLRRKFRREVTKGEVIRQFQIIGAERQVYAKG